MPASISYIQSKCHQIAREKGWWDKPRNMGETAANIHAEISEAWEEFRSGRGVNQVYYEGDKPCGIPVELADVVIRIFDFCGGSGIDLESVIKEKMDYNSSRDYRHGGKKA